MYTFLFDFLKNIYIVIYQEIGISVINWENEPLFRLKIVFFNLEHKPINKWCIVLITSLYFLS
jgi:hypothetical protein